MVTAGDQSEVCLTHSEESALRQQDEAHEGHACESRPAEQRTQCLGG
jgi:hypothetical protein